MSPGRRPSPIRPNIGHMTPMARITSPRPIRRRWESAVRPLAGGHGFHGKFAVALRRRGRSILVSTAYVAKVRHPRGLFECSQLPPLTRLRRRAELQRTSSFSNGPTVQRRAAPHRASTRLAHTGTSKRARGWADTTAAHPQRSLPQRWRSSKRRDAMAFQLRDEAVHWRSRAQEATVTSLGLGDGFHRIPEPRTSVRVQRVGGADRTTRLLNFWVVVQNHVQQGGVNFQFSIVLDEA
jgi:hypothetical protein